ncbi:methyltransferase domain-containing protein [Aliiglaciecola sp. 3_MG-2023]|uniref:methyltransferase domain-containing protein n=1 Tax=Aliiglaciecola sp. 3_MG-2023 TaxID=3062644 RepID=UPI0026E115A9|nr:methyltransferase domain-containing protein [Aliiglaciecola sp. 3_MG-2023]MDO6695790.1 methyltransferase domain-containing protein [Aliiglaciecola sp. 3_MG-2023]
MESYWSQYWQQGHLTSFGNDFTENYTGVLKSHWEKVFTTVQSQTKVLDIGTGNGSIIALGNNVNSELVFTGLDSAKLNIPATLQTKQNVLFVEETSAEKLPFENDSYGCVVSQFGIEYSCLSKSIEEVARVLKSTGRFEFVLHDIESTIVKPNIQMLEAGKALLNSEVIDSLRKLFNGLAKYGQQSPLTEQLRHKLNADIGTIATQHATGLQGTNFPAFLKHVMNTKLDLKQRKSDLKIFLHELEGQIERLSDLVNAALDKTKYQQLIQLLAEYGLQVVNDEYIVENGKMIGRYISGTKANK